MRKKKFKVILMMILFIVFIISTSVSYGYFNNKFKGIHGANGLLQGINIENGKIVWKADNIPLWAKIIL